MENQSIIEHILADTKELMALKVDNAQVVRDKFKAIMNRVEYLRTAAGESNERYAKAFAIMQAAMDSEYEQFNESSTYEQKEQALIALRHKAAEVSELIQAHQDPMSQPKP